MVYFLSRISGIQRLLQCSLRLLCLCRPCLCKRDLQTLFIHARAHVRVLILPVFSLFSGYTGSFLMFYGKRRQKRESRIRIWNSFHAVTHQTRKLKGTRAPFCRRKYGRNINRDHIAASVMFSLGERGCLFLRLS